jgi:hypothetical protein
MKKLFVLTLLFPAIFAAVGKPRVVGTLTAVDKKYVRVTGEKYIYEVPKKFVSVKQSKPGQKVSLALTEKEFRKVKVKDR